MNIEDKDPFAAERARLRAEGIDPASVGLDGGTGDPTKPQMSIEDQIQTNIDQIQSTPGFEGYVPSGTPTQVNRPNMRDVAGEINLNMTDLGNPLNDSRVVSEEQGLSGGFVPTNRPNMRDVAGDINENLIDRGNPFNDSRVVSEEQGLAGGITDRGRGMPGQGEMGAYEMIGGTPVAIGDVLGKQQALEKADFYEPSKKGMDLGVGSLLSQAIGTVLGMEPLSRFGRALGAKNLYDNYRSGKLGQVLGAPQRGLTTLNRKMRGVNPITGRANTQAQYEANRARRQRNNRIDNMLDRKAKGKSYSQKNLNELTMGSRPGHYDKPGGDNAGNTKIVCTMMNERYGFGSFRNKIWMKFHENHGLEYQKGYHTIFLPLVKIAKGKGKINTAVRKVLEHMGRHVTADMFKIMKGKKRDTLGRIYRAIFEPTCRIIGKIKSALGRG